MSCWKIRGKESRIKIIIMKIVFNPYLKHGEQVPNIVTSIQLILLNSLMKELLFIKMCRL